MASSVGWLQIRRIGDGISEWLRLNLVVYKGLVHLKKLMTQVSWFTMGQYFEEFHGIY